MVYSVIFFLIYTCICYFEMASIKEKFNELVESLRQNSAEKAKRIVTETPELMSYKDDSGRLPIHWAASGIVFLKIFIRIQADARRLFNCRFLITRKS